MNIAEQKYMISGYDFFIRILFQVYFDFAIFNYCNWEFSIEIYFFWSRISENKKKPNHDSRKLKFAIFENFTNIGESIRDINEGSRE